MTKIPLIGLTEKELQDVAVSLGMQKFVGRQLAQWIYQKGALSFDEMANISKRNKELLAEQY
ncbi:MAG: 23S rRNA (adenine(2503)-C(2))-methyltransferase RlmN, partial [Muribaculaceae bacterium]|nr:23S rRNA (adenine(2503)-C(2))-methyltransferase RlmN [Muribaculaceae bacterium]